MKVSAEVTMTPLLLAEAFCEMDDESQAQFFIECARIAEAWKLNNPQAHGAWWQWEEIGGHLRKCACSTEEARDMIRRIAAGMDTSVGGE